MFKFIKSIKASMKEGIDEGRKEMRLEVVENTDELEEPALEQSLQAVSADEQFAVALCAPYREVYSRCIGSWAGKSAVTLYQTTLPSDDLKSYADILKRDFNVVDEVSSLNAIQLFEKELEEGTGYAKAYEYLQQHGMLHSSVKEAMALPGNHYTKKSMDAVLSNQASHNLGPQGGDAFRIAVIAHIASAADALGFMQHEQAMQHLLTVSHRAKKRYASWQHYSDGFIAGQRAWGHQGIAAEKVLAGAIKKLHTKELSPWRTIRWD